MQFNSSCGSFSDYNVKFVYLFFKRSRSVLLAECTSLKLTTREMSSISAMKCLMMMMTMILIDDNDDDDYYYYDVPALEFRMKFQSSLIRCVSVMTISHSMFILHQWFKTHYFSLTFQALGLLTASSFGAWL